MIDHTIPQSLPWGKGSIAYFARGACRHLIVFIHGFGGGAASTWNGMEHLVQEAPTLHDADIVFYGYDSRTVRAQLSATGFRQFMTAAADCQPPWQWRLFKAIGGRTDLGYDRVTIIAHSLGALVSRRALLDSIGEGEEWPQRGRLLLFAPAHLGATPIELARELGGRPAAIAANLFALGTVVMPVLKDLDPKGKFIAALISETRRRMDPPDSWLAPLKATKVVFGQYDKVVEPGRFCDDPAEEVWDDEGHCSVCRCPQAPHAVRAQL